MNTHNVCHVKFSYKATIPHSFVTLKYLQVLVKHRKNFIGSLLTNIQLVLTIQVTEYVLIIIVITELPAFAHQASNFKL